MKHPNTPISTRLSGSAKELELRIRNIVQWKKKRPPVALFVLTLVVLLACFGLFSCSPQEEFSEKEPATEVTPEEKDVVPEFSKEEFFARYVVEFPNYIFDGNPISQINGHTLRLSDRPENGVEELVVDDYLPALSQRYASVTFHDIFTMTPQDFSLGGYFSKQAQIERVLSDMWTDARVLGLSEYTVVYTDLSWTHTEESKALGPQLGDGRYERLYLLGRTEESSEWNIAEVYWGEYVFDRLVEEKSNNDPSAVLAAMAEVKSSDFTNPDSLGLCVTADQLATALNAAVDKQISEAEFMEAIGGSYAQVFPHWYIEDAWMAGSPVGHPGTDRNLDIRCGLPENIVEVTLSEDNHRDTAYFKDAALYWLVRTKDAFEDRMTSRDPVAYEQFEPLLIDQMERTLASMSDNPGNFTGYELKRFTIAWTYDNEADGSHVKVYNFSFGLLTDTPETVGWAGGMALDSHLRVVNVGEPKYFAVKYRDGQVVSTAFLGTDYELGRSDRDKERVNSALTAAEQTTSGAPTNTLELLAAYRAILHGQAEYYDVESGRFLNLDQVQAYGYSGNGPSVDLSNFTVVDLDRDGVSEVVVVANWGTDMVSHSIILHYQNGTVYGYTKYIRQFNYLTLKRDGTFSWAGSAFYHGIGQLAFGQKEMVTNQITYVDATSDPIVFVVESLLADKAAFDAAYAAYDAQPDVIWYERTAENINTLLAE